MEYKRWNLIEGNSPLIATAIHDGHTVRDELKSIMILRDEDQLREEDPLPVN